MCLATDSAGVVSSNAATLSVVGGAVAGRLANLSCRVGVGAGASQLIAGFVIGGPGDRGHRARADPRLGSCPGPVWRARRACRSPASAQFIGRRPCVGRRMGRGIRNLRGRRLGRGVSVDSPRAMTRRCSRRFGRRLHGPGDGKQRRHGRGACGALRRHPAGEHDTGLAAADQSLCEGPGGHGGQRPDCRVRDQRYDGEDRARARLRARVGRLRRYGDASRPDAAALPGKRQRGLNRDRKRHGVGAATARSRRRRPPSGRSRGAWAPPRIRRCWSRCRPGPTRPSCRARAGTRASASSRSTRFPSRPAYVTRVAAACARRHSSPALNAWAWVMAFSVRFRQSRMSSPKNRYPTLPATLRCCSPFSSAM